MAGLTDEEMAALEAKEGGLTDEQLNARENTNRTKPLNPTMGEHLADSIRRLREQAPNKVRSAAMGLYNNAASIPEEVYKTIVEPDGQNPGWHTEHPEVREKYMKDVREQPGSNMIGSMLQPGPLSKLKAASTMGKVGLAGLRTGYAGASGSLADYLGHAGPEAQDTGILPDGAALPMGVQAGAELASPLLGKVAGGLRNVSGWAAANAAGLRGGITNQAKRAGIPSLDAAGEEAIPKLGNQMLDEGLIPFMGSKVGVQRRAEKMMDQAGTAADGIRTRADMTGTFSSPMAADEAARRLGSKIDPTQGGNLQTARAAGRAEEFIADAEKTPGTFRDADNLKRGAYGNTNWSTEAPDAAKLKRTAVSGYRQSMEDQVDALLPGEGKALHNINEKYGIAAKTADFAEEAATREAASSKFGWGSMMLGAAGVGAGNGISPSAGIGLGIGLPIAAHLAKTRGAASVASPLRAASQFSGFAGRNVNQSPAASAAVGNALEEYLKPKDDEERQEEGARWLTGR